MDRGPQPRTLVGFGTSRISMQNHYNRVMFVLTEPSAKGKAEQQQGWPHSSSQHRDHVSGPFVRVQTHHFTVELLYLRCWWCWAQRHSSTWQAAHTLAGPAGCFGKSHWEPIMQLFDNSICAVGDAALAARARRILVPSALRFGDLRLRRKYSSTCKCTTAVTYSRPTQAPISRPPRGLSLPASAWGCLGCLGLDHSGAETPLLPGAMQLLPSPAVGYGHWLVAAAADLVSKPQVPYMYAASAGLVLLMSPLGSCRASDGRADKPLPEFPSTRRLNSCQAPDPAAADTASRGTQSKAACTCWVPAPAALSPLAPPSIKLR